ncbi:glycerol-3-phosphate dehydrogenase [Deinococcus irradiatisoli]|uniref:Glycerol-3-phosphate dehydrogenase [NAD(P)+] n=1 Tax=Deinococcus irradiatisoli TaxID=2202254 RepID=A0A2Z3JLP2_9DEIO|nr:NAD(P)H-dependent glycerol-3-phosphate dehydrogenase [Deinococcus irradiatisoli]AWN24461.1 glycerol-3-phosphate dehydrogenase [Deinococcus irradiatisoli]
MSRPREGGPVVLGAGGWGSALAVTLAQTHPAVTLWARREALADELRRIRLNAAYLPGVALPSQVNVTSDLAAAVAEADFAFAVVPSVGMADLLSALPTSLGLVLCAKGLAPGGQRLSELAAERGFRQVAVLSGPNHAEEVGLGLPAATVIASRDEGFAHRVQQALMTPSLRVYTSRDVAGVELGGVLKNVVAVAAGLGDGLALGDNARASVITRGLREMARYLGAQGAQADTVYGLSGLGDLVATATSRHSRNRAAGEAIARGQAPERGGQVVEGLRTARFLAEWAEQHDFDLPIVQAVAAVSEGRLSPQDALRNLMQRQPRAEG